jgi:syntaxin-binding protein 5
MFHYYLSLKSHCRRLCVAGYSGHVILFKFRKQESLSETLVLEIPITYENTDETESPECEFIPRSLPKQPDSTENEKKVSERRDNVFSFIFFRTFYKM